MLICLIGSSSGGLTNKCATSSPRGVSTYKNPNGQKAWELIDRAGCRGLRLGKAQVSEKHCNFLVNLGGATAADIEGLGEEVRRRVRQNTGVERFNAEWLFRVPVKIQGMMTNTDGVRVRSFAALNLKSAYGLTLPLRKDSDLDGWPDVWDHAPLKAGYRDGTR